MRRACDWLVDRFLIKPPDPPTRAALRLGAYQLEWLHTPPHAAVSETVAVAPGHTRGLVNAVLRRVAAAGHPGAGAGRGTAVRLSYPDWIVDRLVDRPGPRAGPRRAGGHGRTGGGHSSRADGYVQDRASQWVAAALGRRGRRAWSTCAPHPAARRRRWPRSGASVVAALDVRPARGRPGRGERRPPGARAWSRRSWATAPRRRCVAPPPTASSSTPRARGWACSGAARTPAGGSTPATWRPWPICSGGCSRRGRSARLRVASSPTACARSPPPRRPGMDAWVAGHHPELDALPPPACAVGAGRPRCPPAAADGRDRRHVPAPHRRASMRLPARRLSAVTVACRIAPSILSADFAGAGAGDRSRRAESRRAPRRRHGRPLRPQPDDRPTGGGRRQPSHRR